LKSIQDKDAGFLDVRRAERDRDDMWHRFLPSGLLQEFTGQSDQAFEYYFHALEPFELHNRSIEGGDAQLNSLYTENIGRLLNALPRLAIHFHSQGREAAPRLTLVDGVDLACPSWNSHALSFLEMGRARSLLESTSFGVKKNTEGIYRRRLLAHLLAIS
jgi:hypothetical protein